MKTDRFAINQKHAGAPPPLLVPSGKDWKWTAQFLPPPLSGVPSNLPWASLQSSHRPQHICETSSHLTLLTPNPQPPDDQYQEIHRCSIIRHLPGAWGPWHTRVFLPSKSMDPKSSHHKRKKKMFFLLLSIWDDGGSLKLTAVIASWCMQAKSSCLINKVHWESM